MKNEEYYDGTSYDGIGYGLAGNIGEKHYIDNLPIDKQDEYRRCLEKEDSVKYAQFVEWEKRMDSISDEEMEEFEKDL